jgi:hypothetical protein
MTQAVPRIDNDLGSGWLRFRGHTSNRLILKAAETLTPETNAVDFARLLQDTITR